MYGGCCAFSNAEDMKSNVGSILQGRCEGLSCPQEDESRVKTAMPIEQFPMPTE